MSGRPDSLPTWSAEGVTASASLPATTCASQASTGDRSRSTSPSKAGKVYRAGGNLTLSNADVGTHTWEDFLSAQA
jgi:hypothetical protein